LASGISTSNIPTDKPRQKRGRPLNSTNINIEAKKQSKLVFMNNVTSEYAKLHKGMGSKRNTATKFSKVVLECKLLLDINPNDVHSMISAEEQLQDV